MRGKYQPPKQSKQNHEYDIDLIWTPFYFIDVVFDCSRDHSRRPSSFPVSDSRKFANYARFSMQAVVPFLIRSWFALIVHGHHRHPCPSIHTPELFCRVEGTHKFEDQTWSACENRPICCLTLTQTLVHFFIQACVCAVCFASFCFVLFVLYHKTLHKGKWCTTGSACVKITTKLIFFFCSFLPEEE